MQEDLPPEWRDDAILKICDIEFECYDFDHPITLRKWFKKVLFMLVKEQEGFSSKRPFGNGGWVYYLGKPFVIAGLIEGDEEGYPEDRKAALDLLLRAVDLLLGRDFAPDDPQTHTKRINNLEARIAQLERILSEAN